MVLEMLSNVCVMKKGILLQYNFERLYCGRSSANKQPITFNGTVLWKLNTHSILDGCIKCRPANCTDLRPLGSAVLLLANRGQSDQCLSPYTDRGSQLSTIWYMCMHVCVCVCVFG